MAITKEYIVLNEVEVDFVTTSPSTVVICPQYENSGRAIKVKLKNNGKDFPVPEGYTPYVYGVKFDQKLVDNLCEYDGNTVMVEVTKQLSAVKGRNIMRVALVNDETGEYAQTGIIYLMVTDGADIPGAERSTDEFGALVQYMKQANASAEAAKASETNAKASETNAKASETNAKSSETASIAARKGAEDAEGRVQAIVAGNESYTKQQANDRFALALKGTADAAKSITIYPDEGSNVVVTAHGFTKQEGFGDASLENVRPIVNGGVVLQEYALTGKETFWGNPTAGDYDGIYIYAQEPFIQDCISNVDNNAVCTDFKNAKLVLYAENSANSVGYFCLTKGTNQPRFIVPHELIGTNKNSTREQYLAAFKQYLTKRYESGNPVKIYYQKEDGTGLLYASILASTKDNFHTNVCAKLTAKLCQGDKLITKVKSGCDQMVVLGVSTVFTLDGANTFRASLQTPAASGEIEYSSAYPWSGAGVSTGKRFSIAENSQALYVVDGDFSTAEEFNAHITALEAAGKPVIVWYKSTAYAEANNKPVSLEVHAQWSFTMNGTEHFYVASSDAGQYILSSTGTPPAKGGSSSGICSIAKNAYGKDGSGYYLEPNRSTLVFGKIFANKFESVDTFKAKLVELYNAGTPARIVYPLAVATAFAHEPIDFITSPDEEGAWVITGEADGTVSAEFNKNVTKAFEEILTRVSALELNALGG